MSCYGETFSTELGKWDLISLPEEVYHDIQNHSDNLCAIQTLLSKPRPDRDRSLLDLQAATCTS